MAKIKKEKLEELEIQTTFNTDTIEELNEGEYVIENLEEVEADGNEN